MRIIVELELSSPYDLTEEEVEKDIRKAENEIGWDYDYEVRSVKAIRQPVSAEGQGE